MAKKIHFMGKNGRGLCGIRPRSKKKGTIINIKVTCSKCLLKMGIDPMSEIRARWKNRRY